MNWFFGDDGGVGYEEPDGLLGYYIDNIMTKTTRKIALPLPVKGLEDIKKGQTWYFVYPLAGHIMLFAKDISLKELRKKLEYLLEILDDKLEKGETEIERGCY